MICVDTEYSYMGAVVKVVVEGSSEEVCNEVKDAGAKGYEGFTNLFKKHGGCRVISELPLKIIANDGAITATLEPANFIAKAFWSEAVKRISSAC